MRQSLHDLLIANIGSDATTLLESTLGGQRIWVRTPGTERRGRSLHDARPPWTAVEAVIGVDAADRLSRAFGGEYLPIPKGPTALPLIRQCQQLHKEGKRPNEIAQAIGRSRRQVFRYLNTPIKRILPKRPVLTHG